MWIRRCLTIPAYAAAWAAVLGTLPLLLLVAAAVDAVRRPRVAVRATLFAAWYLTCEVLGLLLCVGLWLARRPLRIGEARWRALHYGLQARWGGALFAGLARAFRLRVETEGAAAADLGRGPYLLLVRHASAGDTLLASALVARPYGTQLRYVLKRELLWDPCLDVVGHRLPNVFVDRSSRDTKREVARVRALARDLGPREAALIYPEGTRFRPEKRARIVERRERAGDVEGAALARELEHTLPPRPGGTLGLLAEAPEADVVVCMHTGLEGTATFRDVAQGALLGRTLRVRFERHPRETLPDDEESLREWLVERWRAVDEWVGSRRDAARA